MDIDASIRASREPVASRDTALACFVQVGVLNGLDPLVAAARRGDVADNDSLPISGLIELADEFKSQAEYTRTDWQGLQTIGFANPILVLLKNTNVVILTGGGRDGAEEVAVWDPLHRDSERLFVPRQEFERAWSGDVLKLTLQRSSAPSPALDDRSAASKQVSDNGKEELSHSAQRRLPLARYYLVAVAIMATVGVGSFLFLRTPDEHFAPASASVGEVSEGITEEIRPKAGTALGRSQDQQAASVTSASAVPMPDVSQSNTAAAGPPPGEPAASEADRLAALPPAPAPSDEGRPPQALPAAPASVAPPTSGVSTTEPDSTGSPSASVMLPGDAALSAADISLLLTRGDKSFSSGDLASARLYYGRAANAGDGQAALRLGETFDPAFLEQAHLRGARGDLTAALSWYRRARDMGVGEAEVLLNSLEAK
jgi:hypothetical protein